MFNPGTVHTEDISERIKSLVEILDLDRNIYQMEDLDQLLREYKDTINEKLVDVNLLTFLSYVSKDSDIQAMRNDLLLATKLKYSHILNDIRDDIKNDPHWRSYLENGANDVPRCSPAPSMNTTSGSGLTKQRDLDLLKLYQQYDKHYFFSCLKSFKDMFGVISSIFRKNKRDV